jgi:hypothetical protein
MTNFPCGVTAKLLVLRLHRIKSGRLSLNITEIWQLRRHKKPNRKLLRHILIIENNAYFALLIILLPMILSPLPWCT